MNRYYITHDGEGVIEVIEADKKPPNTLCGPFATREKALDYANKEQVELQRQTGQQDQKGD